MIDLCIVSHNTVTKLKRLLDFLHLADDSERWNVWVADNGSTDGSADFLHKCHYRTAGVFYNDNVGYARACNHLASQGKSDVIGLLNSDVWLTATDLRKIQEAFDTSDVSILGPKQRDERRSITHGGIFGSNTAPWHRGWHEADPQDELYRDVKEAVTVSGAAYFIRRSVWEDLTECPIYQGNVSPQNSAEGAFLPTQHYYEETYCSYHARSHGYKIVYDGSISIGHSWHASSEPGGAVDQLFSTSRDIFRKACDAHQIEHD